MRAANATDQSLIEQLRKHDENAVTELVVTYRPKVYQLAFRYLRNKEDAEEVSQDVLMKVINKIAAFRGDSALSSWIYRITFNTAMSRLRNGRAQRSSESDERLDGVGGDRERSRRDAARRGGLVGARRRARDARGVAREPGEGRPGAAGDLPRAGHPARHPGADAPKRRARCCR